MASASYILLGTACCCKFAMRLQTHASAAYARCCIFVTLLYLQKTVIKNYEKKYLRASDTILCHPCKFQFFLTMGS